MRLVGLLALVVLGCTKPNPAVCCIDTADCEARGLPEVRICAAGLACVDNQCEVPLCSTAGCAAALPVCNTTIDVCEGCTESSQCSRFPETAVCETTSGACVQCVAPTDCPAARPICEANACRGCKLDSECASGACGVDGACVDESSIVYLDPGGTDTGTCPRSTPCRTFAYAIPQTSDAKNHVVLHPGGYVEYAIVIDPQQTAAQQLFLHGAGASISLPQGNEGPLLQVRVSAVIRHLEFFGAGGNGVHLGSSAAVAITAEDIKIHNGYRGIVTVGPITLRDIEIDGATYALDVGVGQLVVDRAVIRGGTFGVYGGSGSLVDISNALIFGTSDRAIELPLGGGTIAFSTIADAGTDSGTGARAVSCSNAMTIRSSIIWAPGTVSRLPFAGCNAVTTIAGPATAPGAMNVDPKFVDSSVGNYHLSGNSPARDAVDTGPTTDFEGDARPRGARYDIGGDEAAP